MKYDVQENIRKKETTVKRGEGYRRKKMGGGWNMESPTGAIHGGA